jgi:hypothetical protein
VFGDELYEMAAKDVEFARELETDMSLRIPFAKAMSEVYLDHSYDRPFINNATLGRIRSGLINKADFAVAQKEYFMTNESSLDPEEKKRVGLKIREAIGEALYYLKGFENECRIMKVKLDWIRHHYNDEAMVGYVAVELPVGSGAPANAGESSSES